MTEDALVLVNARNPLRYSVKEEELVCVSEDYPDVRMVRPAAEALKALLRDIRSGSAIVPVSGWRSRQEQRKIWDETVRERGEAFARKFVALPGCSEHETGLAIDLAENTGAIDFICPVFPYTGICGEFRKKAPYYGFIERYPGGKESITGIGAEPWHFRYVGLPHSVNLTEWDMVLEEYAEHSGKGRKKGEGPNVQGRQSLG